MQHTLIEAPPSDGQIYRKIRQYSRQNDAVAERQWWTRLGSENKRRDLKRLLRHERYTTALDTLLDIPGLWEGVRGGMWKKMMDLGCEEVGCPPQIRDTLTKNPSTGGSSLPGTYPSFLVQPAPK